MSTCEVRETTLLTPAHQGPFLQAPSDVVMVRPAWFRTNSFSEDDNPFQVRERIRTPQAVAADAYQETTLLAHTLRSEGVTVRLFEDSGHDFPDSVFPNNWFSTHADGQIALYPMFSPNRRGERRADIIDSLWESYEVTTVLDYSATETRGIFVESTGAMVLDHIARAAYIGRSNRADEVTARGICADLGYRPVFFDTADSRGIPIYHTNVMMSIGTDFAVVALDAIPDAAQRAAVERGLRATGRTVVELTLSQVDDFAGNVIELQGANGRLLAISQRALDNLRPDQRAAIDSHATLLPVAVPTIELSGGSVRCMLAGIHLARRQTG